MRHQTYSEDFCKVRVMLSLPPPSRTWWLKANSGFYGHFRRFSQLLAPPFDHASLLFLALPGAGDVYCRRDTSDCRRQPMLLDMAVLILHQHNRMAGDLATHFLPQSEGQILGGHGVWGDTAQLLLACVCAKGCSALCKNRLGCDPSQNVPVDGSCASVGPQDDWISMRLYSSEWKVLSNGKILFY